MSSPPANTRERILDATWHLMEQNRGEGVRLEDVAAAAKISRQAVYLHFRSRTELLIATTRYVDDVLKLNERLEAACAAKTGVESLDAVVDFWANYMPEIRGLAKALLNVRDHDEAAAAAWDDRMQALYDGCVIVIGCLERQGALAPEWNREDAADFFWATISFATWENLTIDRRWSQAKYIERTKWVLKRALLRS